MPHRNNQIAKKWDSSDKRKRVGRPRIRQVIVDLILCLAQENPTWGSDRIQGALANVGYSISDTTVGNVLKQHGIPPAPNRKRRTTWAAFLKAHWEVLAAIDFTTVEVWTKGGLVTYYLLLVMHVATRRVHFAGCTTNPHAAWMKQAARELTNFEDGFLNGKRYLIMDRDGKFCDSFRAMLEDEGVKCVQLPPRSPNLNSYASLWRVQVQLAKQVRGRTSFYTARPLGVYSPCRKMSKDRSLILITDSPGDAI